MALSFSYAPDYALYVKQPGDTYVQLNSVQSVDATLVTSAGQNQMRVLLADVGGAISKAAKKALHPMQAIRLQTVNRYGQWGNCFTGYITSVHHLFDTDSGDVIQLMCAGPDHLWDITTTSPQAAVALAVAQMRNVAASEVLLYSADQVGYPRNLIQIDPVVDSGTGLQGSLQDVTYNPSAQQWTSVIQSLLSNSGIEWFFDEDGSCHWRRVGYLNVPPHGYRQVRPEELIHADLGEGDDGVVTQVRVRYSTTGTFMMSDGSGSPTEAIANAPQAMVDHLHARDVVIYVPYLTSGFQAAAQYLADTLLQQYAANVLTGTVTIPADPMFRVGSVCDVPSLKDDGSMVRFYISSVTYQMQWNGPWTMTLGLTYGRAPGQNFPYSVHAAYPLWTTQDQAQATAGGFIPNQYSVYGLAMSETNPSDATHPFTLIQKAGVPDGQVLADPGLLPPGSQIGLLDSSHARIGSHSEYTTADSGHSGGDYTLYVAPNKNLPSQVWIKVVSFGDSGAATQPTGTVGGTPGSAFTPPGTGYSNGPSSGDGAPPPTNGSTLALRAMATAYAQRDPPGQSHYRLGDAGPDYWDCSGLVYWAYKVQGFDWDGTYHNSGLEYNYLLAHGARAISVDQAKPGDLLFIGPGSHVGFCWKAGGFNGGQTYGANNNDPRSPSFGLRVSDINGFLSEGQPFNLALDMSRLTTRS